MAPPTAGSEAPLVRAWRTSRTASGTAGSEAALARAWRFSILGRLLSVIASWLAGVADSSRFLALAPAVGRPLSEPGGPLSTEVVGWPYRALSRWLGGGAVGGAVRAAFAAVSGSAFAVWRWLHLAGAGLAGLALGRLLVLAGAAPDGVEAGLPAAAWVAVLVGGLAVAWAGPRLAAAASGSWLGSAGRVLALALGAAPSRGLPRVERRSSAPGEAVARTPEGAGGLVETERARAAGAPGWALAGGLAVAGALGVVAGLSTTATVLLVVGLIVVPVAAIAVVYRPELLLLVLAAFPWVDWSARAALGPLGAFWDELLIVGALASLLFTAVVVRRWDLSTVPITLPLLVALAAAAGSIAVNAVPQNVAVYGLRVIFQPLLFFYLGYLLPRDLAWMRRTVMAFLGASVLLALHGLFQYATNAPMPASWVDAREAGAIGTRAYSIIDNPNGLGAFLLIGALVAGALALSVRRPLQRGLLGVTTLVLVAGVGVTFSRGAWLGLVVGLVAMSALAYRRLFAAVLGGGLVVLLLLPRAFLERITFAFSSAYISKSLVAGRLLMWRIALIKAVEQPLFGVGLGTFGGTTAFLWGYSRLWIDNYYLQLAAEGGFVLLFAFLWLLLRVGKGLVAAHVAVSPGPPTPSAAGSRLAAGPAATPPLIRSARGDVPNGRDSAATVPWGAVAEAAAGDDAAFLRGLTAGAFGAFAAVSFANLTAGVWETLVVGAGFWFLTGLAASVAVAPPANPVRPAKRSPGSARPEASDEQ